MITVSIQEAKKDFSKLLDRVLAGEEVIIAEEDQEVAVVSPTMRPSKPRVPGTAKNQLEIAADFDSPLAL